MHVARSYPPGTVVVAGEQTDGRGRLGRKWHSPMGGLWATFVVDHIPPERCAMLFSSAVARTLRGYGLPATVKWPNDVLVNGRKICGILGEATGGKTLVGVGINVRNDPPPHVYGTSLHQEGVDVSPLAVLMRLLAELEALHALPHEELFALWKSYMSTLGTAVEYEGAIWAASDVLPDGSLVLTRGGVKKIVRWGEVVHLTAREGL